METALLVILAALVALALLAFRAMRRTRPSERPAELPDTGGGGFWMWWWLAELDLGELG